ITPDNATCGDRYSDLAVTNRNILPLDATGTYTVRLLSHNGDARRKTAQIGLLPADVTGTIVPGGPPVTVTTEVGQDVSLTFEGTAGQRVWLYCAPANDLVRLFSPDGSTASLNETTCGQRYGDPVITNMNQLRLRTTGTYTLRLWSSIEDDPTKTLQLGLL